MFEIVTPATTRALTTLDAVRAELGTDGGDETWLVDAIGRASAAVERWCGRTFALERVRETVRLSAPAGCIMLRRFPVVTIHSITEGGAVLPAERTEVEAAAGLLYRLTPGDQRVSWWPGKVVIEYSAGFVLPGEDGRTLPADIELATILLVTSLHHARGRDPALKSTSVDGVGTDTYWLGQPTAPLPPDAAGLLEPHRVVVLG